MQHTSHLTTLKSCLDGLWVLLVEDSEGAATAKIDGRVPMMARSGNDQTYLLGFKNMAKARQFLTASSIEDAEPRMVVGANKDTFLDAARANGVVGVLVDYDPSTHGYATASELY
jgi:hypothetical protein